MHYKNWIFKQVQRNLFIDVLKSPKQARQLCHNMVLLRTCTGIMNFWNLDETLSIWMNKKNKKQKKNLVTGSLQVNYTDWAIAAGRWLLMPTIVIDGWRLMRATGSHDR
jgi:hypothetical protein